MDVVSKLHDLASDPCVYDFLKNFRIANRHNYYQPRTFIVAKKGSALDVGGTGLMRPLFRKRGNIVALIWIKK
jgi:hypothetical protein